MKLKAQKMCRDVPYDAVRSTDCTRLQFEATWSDQARLAQRQPGYEWTKTFKATVCDCAEWHDIHVVAWHTHMKYDEIYFMVQALQIQME